MCKLNFFFKICANIGNGLCEKLKSDFFMHNQTTHCINFLWMPMHQHRHHHQNLSSPSSVVTIEWVLQLALLTVWMAPDKHLYQVTSKKMLLYGWFVLNIIVPRKKEVSGMIVNCSICSMNELLFSIILLFLWCWYWLADTPSINVQPTNKWHHQRSKALANVITQCLVWMSENYIRLHRAKK